MIEIPDVYADIGIMRIQSKLFADVTAYMVVTFCVGEGCDHFAVHSDRIEAAMVDFYVCESILYQVAYEYGGGLIEYQTILSYEFSPVADDCLKRF